MYSVGVSLYLNLTQCSWSSPLAEIQKLRVSRLHILITQTLKNKKKLVEKLPYFKTPQFIDVATLM